MFVRSFASFAACVGGSDARPSSYLKTLGLVWRHSRPLETTISATFAPTVLPSTSVIAEDLVF